MPRESKKMQALRKLGVIVDTEDGPKLARIKFADIIADQFVIRCIPEMPKDDQIYSYDKKRGVYRPFNVLGAVRAMLPDKFCTRYNDGEILAHLKATRQNHLTEFDREDDWILNTRSGLLNLKTKKLTRHSPKHLSLQQLPWKYDKTAKCPAIEAFVGQVVTEKEAFRLFESVAWTLTPGQIIKSILILTGGGDNGKSVWLEVLRTFLGKENVSNVPLHELADDRFAAASLVGKYANVAPDIPSLLIQDTSKPKSISGGDTQSLQNKFGKRFDKDLRAKLVFSCNILPRVNDDSEAWFGRYEEVPFISVFRGKDVIPRHILVAKLTTETEMSGLLNKALEVLPALMEHGQFSNSKTVEEKEYRYKTQSDPVFAFVDHALEYIGGNCGIPPPRIWDRFEQFCTTQKRSKNIGKKTFYNKALPNHVAIEHGWFGPEGERYRAFKGLRWKCGGCTECTGCTESPLSKPEAGELSESRGKDRDGLRAFGAAHGENADSRFRADSVQNDPNLVLSKSETTNIPASTPDSVQDSVQPSPSKVYDENEGPTHPDARKQAALVRLAKEVVAQGAQDEAKSGSNKPMTDEEIDRVLTEAEKQRIKEEIATAATAEKQGGRA